MVVVGGCIGTDAHTVGIDAILNIKGFAGEKGLEYYRELKVVNLGAQVSVPQLVERAVEEKADAVLVSQVVTQRDAHLLNTREMSAAFREAFPPARRPLLVVGGPRFDEAMAADLGVDRVFSRGTTPGEVASYLVHRVVTEEEGLMSTPTPSPAPRVAHRRYVPYAERPLRRQPRRRRLGARPVRRRRHRAVHPHRRRRGPVRVLLRRAVPRSGARRRRRRGDRHPDPGRDPLARDGLRAAGGRPRRRSRRVRPPGCCDDPIVATTATGTVVVPGARVWTSDRRVQRDTP